MHIRGGKASACSAELLGQMVRRPLKVPHDKGVKPIDLMWYDVTGEEDGIEYQILDTSNDTHIKAGPSSRTCNGCLPTACAPSYSLWEAWFLP